MSAASTEKVASNEQAESRSSRGLNRTCQACQQRKIKCVTAAHAPGTDSHKCARCSKFKLDCVFLPPAIRRRRNKNEARIKDLERKLQEIQEAISASQTEQEDAGLLYSEASRSDDDNTSWHPDFQQQTYSSAYLQSLETSTMPVDHLEINSADPVATGLVSNESAGKFFSAFCQHMAPIYPLVLLPTDFTWIDARTKKPALFRALLTAGSSIYDPELFKALFRSTGKYLAEEVVVSGKKSLDLIQALLVQSTWYCPTEKFQELKFSQFANMAATLVLDLKSSNDEQYRIPSRDDFFISSEQLIETCRTFLACYFLCSSMALSFRRPTVLCHGPWVDDCIKVLETAPSVHLNDRRLVEWAKLQRIAEESISIVGLDGGSTINLTDDRTRRVLKYGAEQAVQWMQRVPSEILHEPMTIHYHMVLISLHEPAFYDEHDMSDFRPPYKLRPLPLAKNTNNEVSINVANSLAQCVSSAQKVMETFLNLSTESLRSVPVIVYTRVAYSAIVLIKFDVSARMPQSVAYLLDDYERNPKLLLLKLLNKLELAVGSEHFVIPTTFRSVLSRVTKWYIDQFESFMLPDQDDIIEPMMHVGQDDIESSAGSDINYSGDMKSHVSIPDSVAGIPSFAFIM
ncbi:hypothetical protein ACHAQJ_001062 [Trichoderma viride]